MCYRDGALDYLPAWISWTFDNRAQTTAVYRWYSSTHTCGTKIETLGTGWGAGQFVTLRGRVESCPYGDGIGGTTCKNAIWVTERDITGSQTAGFQRQNYVFTQFYDFGAQDNSYRSMHLYCLDTDTTLAYFYIDNVKFYRSVGITGGQYPCSYTDFTVHDLQTFDSGTPTTDGWWSLSPGAGAVQPGKQRTLSYVYLDTGMGPGGGNVQFRNFTQVSYLVLDRQQAGINSAQNGLSTSADHVLIRQTGGLIAAYYFSRTSSYWLIVMDGTGNSHNIASPGGATSNIDHLIYQHGNPIADSDPPSVGGAVNYSYYLLLPSGADPRYSGSAWNGGYNTPTTIIHSMFTFGRPFDEANDNTAITGSMYYGENICGTVGSWASLKNNIFWNPNPTAPNRSPIYAWKSTNVCVNNSLANLVANTFNPSGIHHNVVFGADLDASKRWTYSNGATQCGSAPGDKCSNWGTPYDAPTTGVVPGANANGNDLPYDTNPQFVWQKQGITAPGPRDWAHIRFGAAYDSDDVPGTSVHYKNAFGLFRDADITDLTTTAGMKGRIDDMFTWTFSEWASTNSTLKGAADDGSDIGVAPVVLPSGTCPDAPVGADPSAPCKFVSQDSGQSPSVQLARLRSLAIVN